MMDDRELENGVNGTIRCSILLDEFDIVGPVTQCLSSAEKRTQSDPLKRTRPESR
jgi:hypothetical protein